MPTSEALLGVLSSWMFFLQIPAQFTPSLLSGFYSKGIFSVRPSDHPSTSPTLLSLPYVLYILLSTLLFLLSTYNQHILHIYYLFLIYVPQDKVSSTRAKISSVLFTYVFLVLAHGKHSYLLKQIISKAFFIIGAKVLQI